MRNLVVAALAVTLANTGSAADITAKESGEWDEIVWSPEGSPAQTDIVHIGGGFTVSFSRGASPNLSRLFVGDNFGDLASGIGTLAINNGILTVNGNAAGAILVGHSDGSTGAINITGGTLRGVGTASGAGMQIGFGSSSTGSLTISDGVLLLANGVVVAYADNSTGSFTVSGGTVTVGTGVDAGPFNVGARLEVGGSTTATYKQTGGSVTVASNYFGVGHAGKSSQLMNSVAEITGGTFSGNVRVGRGGKVGGGHGGVLTIGSKAQISGRNEAWVVSGNGEIVFVMGPDETFSSVDLTSAETESALEFTQPGARLTIDGKALKPSMFSKPITLITFAEGKGATEMSKSNLDPIFSGFDKSLKPKLVWTETSLQLDLSR